MNLMVRNAEDLGNLFILRIILLAPFLRISTTDPMTIAGNEVKLLRSSSSDYFYDQCTVFHDTVSIFDI